MAEDASRADVVAFRWWLERELVRVVGQAIMMYDLDPLLLDHLEDAVRVQDQDAFDLALLAALTATLDAREELTPEA